MWWVKTKPEGSDRGGFQNADVGKTNFDDDFGPDYGIDYARLWDTPDLGKDESLRERIKAAVPENINVRVRNGFVLLKGQVENINSRDEIIDKTRSFEGVK